MLVIRLQRTGRKNDPTYRVVLSEKSAPMKSGELEILGHHLPARKPSVFSCNQERVAYWVSKGAQPSNTIARLLKKEGMKGMEKYITTYSKKRSKNAPPPEVAAPAPAPETPAPEAGDSAEKQA